MIVDDSILMRKNIRAFFESYTKHLVVGEAVNGQDALVKFRELLPDLVTMDITMPVCDGITAVTNILQEFPQAKIIMISAVNEKDKIIEALSIGAVHYLLKPLNTNKMLEVIGHFLPNALPASEKTEIQPTSPTIEQ